MSGVGVGVGSVEMSPHLVSLNPPCKLYPLPEAGCVSVGSGSGVDVAIPREAGGGGGGAGDLGSYCILENRNGIVTLTPFAEDTRVNGRAVQQTVRLEPGSTIAVGQSGLFKFNYPLLSNMMKSSMQSNSFGLNQFNDSKKEKVQSTFNVTPVDKYISPKCFPRGSVTVNSPADAVFGQNSPINHISKLNKSPAANDNCSKLNNSVIYQNINCSYQSSKVNNSDLPPSLVNGSGHSGGGEPIRGKVLSRPSASFDRNPTYSAHKSGVVSPVHSMVQSKASYEDDLSSYHPYCSQSSYPYSCSGSGPCSQYNYDLELNKQLDEQLSIQAAEKKQLDEILSVFADYEKKTLEQSAKPHHNRIITNGSLPRDKHLGSPNGLSEYSRDTSFNFDGSSPKDDKYSKTAHFDFEKRNNLEVSDTTRRSCESIISQPNSPRTRIKTTVSRKDTSPSEEFCLEQLETRIASLSELGSNAASSPKPHYTTYNGLNHYTRDGSNNLSTFKMQLDKQSTIPNSTVNSFSPSLHKKLQNGNIKKSNIDIMSRSYTEQSVRNDLNGVNSLSRSFSNERLTSVPHNLTNGDVNRNDLVSALQADVKKLKDKTIYQNVPNQKRCVQDGFEEEKRKIDNLVYELNKLVNQPSKTPSFSPSKPEMSVPKEKSKFILPLDEIDSAITAQRRSLDFDKDTLRNERQSMLKDLVGFKSKVLEIRQQEDEILREMEMECALLEGEYKSETGVIKAEEESLRVLQEKLLNIEKEIEKCTAQQAESKRKLEEEQKSLNELEEKVFNCDVVEQDELMQSYKLKQENLEYEKKNFEDSEFLLLEEEADLLSKREEYQRELNDRTTKLHTHKLRVAQLGLQQKQVLSNAADESKQLESVLIAYLNNIKETRNRIRELDIKLGDVNHCETPSKSILKQSPESSESDDDLDKQLKQQSMDDLNRISKITLGTPIMESNQSNSLGRRTVALLREIEKNRQLVLAKQGSLVIEEERKRVLELKQRVQTEVHAQWEERKQRENNCNSLNSIASEESSLTSSDILSESVINEDGGKTNDKSNSNNSPKILNSVPCEEFKSKSYLTELEDGTGSRQWSEVSSCVSEEQLSTLSRQTRPRRNVQRPLTRYLPFRSGETLDLRQHIISAGHQVELCQHITLDSTSCRGYLQKMTSRFHNWNKRWFLFDRTTRVFSYYSDSSEKKLRGVTHFPAIEEVYVDHLNSVKSPHPNLTFVVKTKGRTYYLMARTPESMRIWVDVIFTGAEGYQEYFDNT
nr:PREDICTED: myosin-J heavy chain [Bemisia tabaci]